MGTFSDIQKITCGVPQGTCLGPLIFLIHTIDIKHHLKHSLMYNFADDTTLITTAETWTEAVLKANRDYELLTDWYKNSRLSLNISKTKYMLFGASPDQTLNLTMQGSTLEKVTEYKLVGLTIDDQLTWKKQVDNTLGNVRRAYVLASQAKHFLPKHTLLLLYHSLFSSYLTYGIEFFGAATKTTLAPLQVVQNKFLRLIDKNKTDEIRKKNKILTVGQTIVKQRILLAHSCLVGPILGGVPNNIKNIFTLAKSNRKTRTTGRLCIDISTPSTAKQHRSSYHQIPYVWNGLTHNIQSLPPKTLATHLNGALSKLDI